MTTPDKSPILSSVSANLARRMVLLTSQKSDTLDLTEVCDGILVTTAGNAAIALQGDAALSAVIALTAGYHPLRLRQLGSTSLTAVVYGLYFTL